MKQLTGQARIKEVAGIEHVFQCRSTTLSIALGRHPGPRRDAQAGHGRRRPGGTCGRRPDTGCGRGRV